MQGQSLLADPTALLKAIVGCLTQLLPDPAAPDLPSPFNLKGAPTISISDYLARLFKYMRCSAGTFIYALALLDRLQEYQAIVLHRRNIHRLLLAASVIAAKYLDDFFYKNSYYANVGGLQLAVLNVLQTEFLQLIGFRCYVDPDTFEHYLQRLQTFGQINTPLDGVREQERQMMVKVECAATADK